MASVAPLISPQTRCFDQACKEFRWNLPAHFNIAEIVCDRHRSLENRVAMFYEDEHGKAAQYTFGQVRKLSNRLANTLAEEGIGEGDRVAIILPQRLETAVAHLALYKLRAIAVPLSGLFGPDALAYRLQDSGSKLVITDSAHREVIEALSPDILDLTTVLDVEDPRSYAARMERASDH